MVQQHEESEDFAYTFEPHTLSRFSPVMRTRRIDSDMAPQAIETVPYHPCPFWRRK
jgi:hypothetical protein